MRTQAESLRAEGIPLHLVADASRAAEVAHAAGLCDEDTMAAVRTAPDPD